MKKNAISRIAHAPAMLALAWSAFGQTASSTQEELVAAYLTIQEQLAADSAEGVVRSANRLAAAARGLAEKKEHAKELQAIARAAEGMNGTEVDTLRAAFAPVSLAMAIYSAEVELGPELLYCPMKKAYWLQKDEEIRNPYYGKSMLTCGQKAEEVER